MSRKVAGRACRSARPPGVTFLPTPNHYENLAVAQLIPNRRVPAVRALVMVVAAAIAVVVFTEAAQATKVLIPGISTSETDNPRRSLDSLAISPDGLTLAVVGNIDSGSTADRLYTIPLAGGALTQVTGSNDVDHIPAYSPDAQTIYYVDSDGGTNKVHSVPAAGGTGTVVNDVPANFGFRLSPNGQTVVALTSIGDDDVLQAFPAAGGGSVVSLSTPAAEGDSDRETFNFSPDGSEVFFATDARFRGANESSLYYVPITGGPGVEIPIAGTVIPTNDIDHVYFVNDTVYFKGDFAVDGENRINTLPRSGGVPEVLDIENLSTGSDVDNFSISPDGNYIAFSADLETIGLFELFVVPVDGGEAIKVSDPFSAEAIDLDITGDGVPDLSDGNIDSDVLREPLGTAIIWAPDSRRIIYLADGETDGVYEPYVVDNLLLEAITGDYNNDGLVDAADYTVWRDTFGSTTDLRADGDESGTVDSGDYTFWQTSYGSPGDTIGSTIPEPTAASLGLTVLLAAAVCRCRQTLS